MTWGEAKARLEQSPDDWWSSVVRRAFDEHVPEPYMAWTDLVEALQRVEELEAKLQVWSDWEAMLNAALVKAVGGKGTCDSLVETLRQRVEELEGEARVLIDCPCWCHTGDGPEPHGDCRECVRGTATPAAIERDHTEALWREKWTAALDLMGSQAERADRAEAEVRRLEGLIVRCVAVDRGTTDMMIEARRIREREARNGA